MSPAREPARLGWRGLALLALIVFSAALWARWSAGSRPARVAFAPQPDALEYAASAQAIAAEGRYYLQVGPHRVRPRYPPGWPLVLAAGLRVGVPPQQLWRVTATFGAALAAVLACAAALATWRLVADRGAGAGVSRLAAWVAGLVAGGGWALGMMPVRLGQSALSDEPAAFFAVTGLLLTGWLLVRGDERTGIAPLATWLLAGAAIGAAATVRSIAVVLMIPPLAILWLGAHRRRVPTGARRLAARLAAFVVGGALPAALVVILLLRSGESPWQWSDYKRWFPKRFERLGDTFHPRYALQPDHEFPVGRGNVPLTHASHGVRTLLGLPGLRFHDYLGVGWPSLAWLTMAMLWWSPGRAAPRRREVRLLVAAAAAWVFGHLVVFALYFYPSARFYAGAVAVVAVLVGVGVGALVAAPRRWLRWAAAGVAVAVVVSNAVHLATRPMPPNGAAENVERQVTRQVTRWLQRTDAGRRGRTVPFDPLEAQALGLLPPERLVEVGAWGLLPQTAQVVRLRRAGVVSAEEMAGRRGRGVAARPRRPAAPRRPASARPGGAAPEAP